MGIFRYDKVVCPKCNEMFKLQSYQKVVHIIRIGSKKLMKCPQCKKWGMCKGLRTE